MAVLMAGMLLLGALTQSEDFSDLAAEYNVALSDLLAASTTVGVTPTVYLRTTAPHAAPPVSTPPVSGVWARLAACESTSNWRAVSPGGTYRGGLQFDQQTWRAYGGTAYASSAHLATPAQQIAVAERLRAARGFQPWPACSRRLGLR